MSEKEKEDEEISRFAEEAARYIQCLAKLENREKVTEAVKNEDLCAIWKIFDACKVPCRDRWKLVKYLMDKKEKQARQGGPLLVW